MHAEADSNIRSAYAILARYEATAGAYTAARILMQDCSQFGWVGSEVRATVMKRLLSSLSAELSAKITRIVDEAVAASVTLNIDSGDDDYMNRGPHIAINDEFEDEASLHWTAGHAADAFETLGYKSEEPDWFCISVPAADLKAKAERRLMVTLDMDTEALLSVATFALKKGGPDAIVSAA